jgi:glutamine amidotransferase
MKLSVINYKGGNIASAVNAIESVIDNLDYEIHMKLTSDPKVVENSDSIIFPGQGAAKQAMKSIMKLGLEEVLKQKISESRPFLGICIGMQILFEYSEEQDTECLGILDGFVKRFDITEKVPHMGWNNVAQYDSPLWNGIHDKADFYHIHSYYPEAVSDDIVIGRAEYGLEFTSVIQRENLFATQFHPEKSGKDGLKLIENFLNYAYEQTNSK